MKRTHATVIEGDRITILEKLQYVSVKFKEKEKCENTF